MEFTLRYVYGNGWTILCGGQPWLYLFCDTESEAVEELARCARGDYV
jgi:hypothetical protein